MPDNKGKGGDINLIPGRGHKGGHGSIKFISVGDTKEEDTVAMSFDRNGEIYVRGELVDNNTEVYWAFRGWLAGATAYPERIGS